MATTVTEISVPFVEQLVAIVVEPSFLLNPKSLALLTIVLATAIAIYTYTSSRKAYLIDFVCFKAPKTHRVPLSTFIEHAEIMEKFDRDTIDFQTKVVERSGIGNQSYLPDGIHFLPPSSALKQGIHELEMVLFSTVGNLFTKLKISPESIDVLITNCSLVTPTPSLSSMVINKFGFRSNVISYNLSGMGCSAGYLEAKGRVRRGDKVWQLGFGSGFKCNSAVWKCISNMKSDHWNAWSDSIDQYPLEVPDSADH
ncbi:3-ketoacyl-CoA synthase 5 [Linum perenne]